MSEAAQRAVTAALVAVCLAGGAVTLAPRLGQRHSPLSVVQPPLEVAVVGEVVRPGVYSLPFGSRVEDAVAASGGPTPGAAIDLVRLAAPLTDGQTVNVPSLMTPTASARVSVNSATVEELDALPGIGPVMARRIVAHRPFSSLDDLLSVPGIGPTTLQRLAPFVGL